MILPKGTAVTVFQTSDDGRWMKAQYGDNYGWIYNRALGAGKNYSSINLSTLPAVADDIVFDLNLNKRRIYNYVYDIGYRNTGNDTTENLCVDALRYGTGSCYHHAALLNYLYNRCELSLQPLRLRNHHRDRHRLPDRRRPRLVPEQNK